MRTNRHRHSGTGGFTLVEILIAVGIIGLLCAIAIPSMVKARQESRISRMMNDIRIVHDAFNMYAMEHGDFPAGFVQGNSTPQPVADYLSGTKWTQPTVMGGGWWYISFSRFDAVSGTMKPSRLLIVDNFNFGGVDQPLAPASDWQKIDSKLDDGNLNTGVFKLASGVQMQYSVDDAGW